MLAASACGVAEDNSRYLGRGMPYGAFDELPAQRLSIAGSAVDVAFAPGRFDLPREDIVAWIDACARSVATYYGRFPVGRLRLLVVPVPGAGVQSGKAFAYGGAAVRLALGESVTRNQLARDWMLVHEMTHLAFPDVAPQHHWIEEGLATYVEPIARAQARQLDADEVWLQLVRGLPKGLPQAGDEGLDHTPTWGRTYWGGALFCLLADIEIRQRTQNGSGLQHALRGVLKAASGMEASWPLEHALKAGDAAVGVPVLSELYERMKATPVEVDLDNLWQRLGVKVQGGSVSYDESAPLAAIRRAITAAPAEGR